jgi:hypothetical protein
MNLPDNIIAALRQQPMTLPEIREAMNDISDYDWSEEFFATRIAQLVLIGRITRNADEIFSVPENPAA